MLYTRQNRKKLVIVLCVVSVVFIFYEIKELFEFKCDVAIIIDKNFKNIPPELMTEDTIYFLETHNSSDHELTAREACAIESAAFMNPDTNIFVLFLTTTSSKHIRLKNWSQFQSILNYDNIHLRYFHIEDVIKESPIEKWIQKGHLRSSSYPVVHTSDILRYTLLYKYSGIYLDMDVIVTSSLDEIQSSNFVCHQDDEKVNNAIIKLSGQDGKEVGLLLLEEVIEKFDGRKWEENGPLLITRALNKFCNTTNLSNIHKCKDFDIFPQHRCYAINWENWKKFFTESKEREVMKAIKDSFFVHFWNAKSKGTNVKTTSHTAFNQLAAKHCPRVHQHNLII